MKTSTLVSVMLPTRKRVEMVQRSVESLLSLAQNPEQIEIIIAYDNDDEQSREYFTSHAWHNLIEKYESTSQVFECEPWSYEGLHHYFNLMALGSQGSWLLIWNDDALMQTKHWDQHVKNNEHFVGMLHMPTENFRKDLTLFPLIPRVWLDLFESVSLTQIVDTWIQEICYKANAVLPIPVTVFHDRFDLTGNNYDDTYVNRKYRKKIFNHEDMKKIRSDWADRLSDYRATHCRM